VRRQRVLIALIKLAQPTARAAAPMLTDLFLVMKTFVVIVQYRGALLLARVILRRSVDNITG
jgi:hypothetical protein